jgi:hypothetical protein
MVIDEICENVDAGPFSKRQQMFLRYTYLVLVDLTVLNLFDQYWDWVDIEFFSISLLAAILLQVLLQVTISIEHRIADYFKQKPGKWAVTTRVLVTIFIIIGSKFAILWAISVAFGDSVLFTGPKHGLVAFYAVVIAIVVTEQIFFKIYRSLAGDVPPAEIAT